MASFHTRSNSLPSRPHPVISELDEHMNRLRDSQGTSTSSFSIGNKLISLQDLHDCVDSLLLLPLAQQVLAQVDNKKQVDELLDGSLRILDLCNIIKDSLSQTKDCIQRIQSAFRRRQGSVETEIKKYFSTRKIVKKTIKKALKNLKSNENKSVSTSSEILRVMREVEAITVNTLESFLSFISSNSKPKRSLVSKLMHHKRVACEEQETRDNEFAIVDSTLESIIGSITCKTDEVEDLQKKLQNLEFCIQHFEDETECLFRKMIKSRASFLNIFN